MKTLAANVQSWLVQPLTTDVTRAMRRLANCDDVQRVVVLPDVHLANDVCVGTVVATTNTLYPAAVGSDIGCGMASVRLDINADRINSAPVAASIFNELERRVPTNRHSSQTVADQLPQELLGTSLSDPRLESRKHRDGRVQLGTLGRGNHFLEFQEAPNGSLWSMVHSGSRAMGQAITRHHQRNGEESSGLVGLRADSLEGRNYLSDAAWAADYAAQSRRAMLGAVAQLVEDRFGATADWDSLIESNHNHVRRETHDGVSYWVHRKGAQSAHAGEPGLIPGSMATATYHVNGRGCPDSLCSSSHGAGRRKSRTEARQTISQRDCVRQLETVWYDQRLIRSLREESPSAYNNIDHVLRAQKDLTRIVRRLRPILVYKGR